MEMPGFILYGNSTEYSRDSPTLLVIREVFNEHITKVATRTKNDRICISRSEYGWSV